MSTRRKRARTRARREVRDQGLGALGEVAAARTKKQALRVMKSADREKFERRQAQVGLASNILGITAGGAALAAAAKNPALRPSRATAETAGPVSRRVLHRIKSAKGKKALIVGGAAGAAALQAANLGGDLVANRVLSRESGMSKADKRGRDPRRDLYVNDMTQVGALMGGAGGYLSGRALDSVFSRGAQFGPTMKNPRLRVVQEGETPKRGSALARRAAQAKRFARRNRFTLGAMSVAVPVQAFSVRREAKDRYDARINGRVKKSVEQSVVSKSEPMVVTGHGRAIVEKRNFNAEADRQRRLGLYAGAGLGAGVVLGDAARRRVVREELELKDGSRRKVMNLPKGRNARLKLAALAAGSVAGVGGGLAAYKRGISERNVSYM